MNIQERVAKLQECLNPSGPSDDWKEKYIVNPGEVPWWEIKNREERQRFSGRQRSRMDHKLHPGISAEAHRRYRERNPGATNEAVRRYREEHLERVTELMRQWRKTPKGRAHLARTAATRRRHSTDPALCAARVLLLHTLKESCANCGASYDVAHQVDHITALCLGGTDNWDNLQPLCVLCHREKPRKICVNTEMCSKVASFGRVGKQREDR